jgi:uncharacterized protein (TIGR02328 family)
MRGNGWGQNHSTVNYVWNYYPIKLYLFHSIVMDEMERRGSDITTRWRDPLYRGKNAGCWSWQRFAEDGFDSLPFLGDGSDTIKLDVPNKVYPEHDKMYLQECLGNLQQKGVDVAEIKLAL